MLKNLLGENVKVNQGFIGAATLFFAGPNCFEHGSKIGPIPLILCENVKKVSRENADASEYKNNPSEMISTKCGSFVNVTIFL